MRYLLVGVLLGLSLPAAARKANVRELVKTFQEAKTEERIKLAAILGRAGTDKAVDALIQAFDIKRGNPRESAAYIEAFGVAGDRRAIEPLSGAWDYLRSLILQMGELPGNLQVLRWKILESMSRLGGPQAVSILSESLNDRDPRVVEEAVRGLGRRRVRDAVPALQQLAASASGNQLQAVLEALGDIGDKRALSTVEQALKNPDPYIELQAAYALAKLGQKDGVAKLESALKSDPGAEKVGLLAAYYLVKLDKDSGLQHLETMMKKADGPLAPLAAETLGKSENPRAALVLAEGVRAPEASVRLSVARSLGRLGGGRSVTALKKLRGDPDPGVRSATISALSELGELE